MDFKEYQKLAQRTSNKELNRTEHIINGALGLCGEAGEVADLLKKGYMQGHEIDRERVLEEAGDVLWYLAELIEWLHADLGEVAMKNIEKLNRRFPDPCGFSVERSVNREKAEG